MTSSATQFEELEFMGPDRDPDQLAGLQVLVLGLGTHGGGTDLIDFLHARGAQVSVSDTASASELSASIDLIAGKVTREQIHTGGHHPEHLEGIDWVVVNPAIPPAAAFLQEVHLSGVRVVTELGLFLAWAPHEHLAAVTGTNGKSTVCALVKEMLLASGVPVEVGGNFGGSLLKKLGASTEETRWIVEISSFQSSRLGLEIPRPPLVALTCFAPDHLDWHGDEATYFQAKMNLLRGPHRKPAKVIVEKNSPFVNALDSLETKPQIVSPNATELLEILEPQHISPALTGDTGHSNLELATALARDLGASNEGCRIAAEKFQGLPHRFEVVPGKDDLIYINDSKATTPDATIAALSRLNGPIHWLCGGKDKGIDIAALVSCCKSANVSVYPYGESSGKLALHFEGARQFETLEQAFHDARNHARAGETILCSPAYPSYDQFVSFEERGEVFRKLVASVTPSR